MAENERFVGVSFIDEIKDKISQFFTAMGLG